MDHFSLYIGFSRGFIHQMILLYFELFYSAILENIEKKIVHVLTKVEQFQHKYEAEILQFIFKILLIWNFMSKHFKFYLWTQRPIPLILRQNTEF